MKYTKTATIYKIKNKTNQYFQLIDNGYLPGYGETQVTEITEQLKKLEKMGLVSIRPS